MAFQVSSQLCQARGQEHSPNWLSHPSRQSHRAPACHLPARPGVALPGQPPALETWRGQSWARLGPGKGGEAADAQARQPELRWPPPSPGPTDPGDLGTGGLLWVAGPGPGDRGWPDGRLASSHLTDSRPEPALQTEDGWGEPSHQAAQPPGVGAHVSTHCHATPTPTRGMPGREAGDGGLLLLPVPGQVTRKDVQVPALAPSPRTERPSVPHSPPF